jgi:RNA polymerase sigma factor (sigma-70 family)
MLRRPAETDAFDDETVAAAAGPDPAAPLVLREQSRAAWCALQDLPAHEREVLALRLYAELDFAEIAKSCGISQIAARQRASRGLGRLRRRLTDGLAASAIPVGASLEAQPGGPKA